MEAFVVLDAGESSRRAHVRLPLIAPVALDQGLGRAVEGEARNLSCGGIGVALPRKIPDWLKLGSLVRCGIDHRRAQLSTWARVAWIGAGGVGLEIVALTTAERDRLTALIGVLELSARAGFYQQMPLDPTLVDSGTWARPAWTCGAGAVSVPQTEVSVGRWFSASLVLGLLLISVLTAVCRSF